MCHLVKLICSGEECFINSYHRNVSYKNIKILVAIRGGWDPTFLFLLLTVLITVIVIVTKFPRRRNLAEEGLSWLPVGGATVHPRREGMTRKREAAGVVSSQGTADSTWRLSHKSSRSAPSDPLPLLRLHGSKFSHPVKNICTGGLVGVGLHVLERECAKGISKGTLGYGMEEGLQRGELTALRKEKSVPWSWQNEEKG